jgi:hypothetical protein
MSETLWGKHDLRAVTGMSEKFLDVSTDESFSNIILLMCLSRGLAVGLLARL